MRIPGSIFRIRAGIIVGSAVAILLLATSWGVWRTPTNPVYPWQTPTTVLMVGNGTRLQIPPSSFGALGPVSLTGHWEWIPSGAWWQSNGTTACFMTLGFFQHWNKWSAPTGCDGWTFVGSPGQSGGFSIPSSIAIVEGDYYTVWYNLSPSSAMTINVTQSIESTGSGPP